MSQALQSLNSLLKYKQERERQKIDKSLSMMDMATRLRQQQLENTRQNQIMQMRVKQENRDSKLFSKQLESAELALEKERRESTPEYIAFEKRQLELKNVSIQVKKDELKPNKMEENEKNIVPIQEETDLSIILLDTIQKVQKDKTYINQANAICNVVSQMINIKKLELQLARNVR